VQDCASHAEPYRSIHLCSVKFTSQHWLSHGLQSECFQPGESMSNTEPPVQFDESASGSIRCPMVLRMCCGLGSTAAVEPGRVVCLGSVQQSTEILPGGRKLPHWFAAGQIGQVRIRQQFSGHLINSTDPCWNGGAIGGMSIVIAGRTLRAEGTAEVRRRANSPDFRVE